MRWSGFDLGTVEEPPLECLMLLAVSASLWLDPQLEVKTHHFRWTMTHAYRRVQSTMVECSHGGIFTHHEWKLTTVVFAVIAC